MTVSVNINLHVAARSPAMQAVFALADGASFTAREDQAVDLGTIATFAGVAQQCKRLIPQGTGVVPAFHVDFRTDHRGKRTVIVEYGTRYRFPVGQKPQTDNNVKPRSLFMPSAATLGVVPGNTTTQSGAATVALSYVSLVGETLASGDPAAYRNLAAGDRLVVKSPAPSGVATGYNVYVRLVGASTARYKQNTAPIPIGQDWTCPTTGLLLAGVLPLTRPSWPALTVTLSGGPLTQPIVTRIDYMPWRTRCVLWEEQALPVARSYQDLVAMKAILPMDLAHLRGATPPPPVTWKGALDTAGLAGDMSGPGERPELGLMTGHQVAYLTGRADYLPSVVAQARAADLVPIWVRDAGLPGAPIADPGVHPFLSFLDAAAGLHQIPLASEYPILNNDSVFVPDVAHFPSLSFVPYMLTGDPSYLEGMQAAAFWGLTEANFATLNSGVYDPTTRKTTGQLSDLVTTSQPRATAWAWRDLFRAASYTPDTVPSWVAPKTTWSSKVLAQAAFVQRFIDNPATPCTSVFRLFPMTNQSIAFMLDYFCHTIAEVKRRGDFPTMNPAWDYIVAPKLAMTDPTDSYGWDHRYPSVYYTPVVDARKRATAQAAPQLGWRIAHKIDPATGRTTAVLDPTPNPDTPLSWAELFQCASDTQIALGTAAWVPPDKLGNRISGYQSGYLTLIRSSLAVLSQAGYPTRKAHDYIESELDKHYPDVSRWYYFQWPYTPA